MSAISEEHASNYEFTKFTKEYNISEAQNYPLRGNNSNYSQNFGWPYESDLTTVKWIKITPLKNSSQLFKNECKNYHEVKNETFDDYKKPVVRKTNICLPKLIPLKYEKSNPNNSVKMNPPVKLSKK